MNDDLISREALRKAFHERIRYFSDLSWDEANAIIDNAPTVEITDYDTGYQDGLEDGLNDIRPQGEWHKGTHDDIVNGIDNIYCQCSVCNFIDYQHKCSKFCENCGADMRGEEENES